MAAFVTTAAMAVSVTVIGPGPAPARIYWEAPVQASLSDAVGEWAARAGLAKPEIDSRVATLSVGHVTVAGADVCDAVGKLVSALKYADQRPEIKACDSAAGAPIVISVASR